MVAPMPPKIGGITIQADLMIKGLEREGMKVIPIDTILHVLDRKYLLPIRLLLQPWVIAFKLLNVANKCDIVHVHAASWWGFIPVLICAPITKWIVRKRLVISFHGGAGHLWLKKWRWLAIPFFNMADAIAVVSPHLKHVFSQYGIRTILLNNLVDMEKFPFHSRGKPSGQLIWIRKFEDAYDPITALRVFERVKQNIPEAEITFIGDGSLLQKMQDYVDQRNLTGVHFTGRLPNAEIHTSFEKADILLNTSIQDGFPTALLEASSSGLPIVSTNVGGISSLIENGVNGILVPVGQIDQMAVEVISLLHNPDKCGRIGVAAEENSKKYSWEACRETLAELYGLFEE